MRQLPSAIFASRKTADDECVNVLVPVSATEFVLRGVGSGAILGILGALLWLWGLIITA